MTRTKLGASSAVVSLGVDWHKRGWVGVLLRSAGSPTVLTHTELGALIARVPDVTCVGVDMPIGLPDTWREADVCARKYVGPRRNSVFMTPPRKVLAARSYAAANAIAPGITGGKKISQQAWALRGNIAVVDELAVKDSRVIEVHPEVSFRAMAGHDLQHAKNTWNGRACRVRCLTAQGVSLPDHLAEGGNVPPADVLDAAAAAWSARRHARHEAWSLPGGAHRGQHGVIWC